MNINEFNKIKVGDRVICNKDCSKEANWLPKKGDKGTVIFKDSRRIQIQWDGKLPGSWNWFVETGCLFYESVSSINVLNKQLEFEF